MNNLRRTTNLNRNKIIRVGNVVINSFDGQKGRVVDKYRNPSGSVSYRVQILGTNTFQWWQSYDIIMLDQ